MLSLNDFVSAIDGFSKLNSSIQIDCFIYFLTNTENKDGIEPKEIASCFAILDIQPYSNIPLYLKNKSKRVRGQKFFMKNNKYFLMPSVKEEIEQTYLKQKKKVEPTDSLFPLELFKDTRGYISKVAEQASICHDYQLFDACAVMLRRLLESLIIESFERKGLDSKIKNKEDNFLYLDDLIDLYSIETTFNISRNSKTSLKKLKGLGDMSAHNRRYLAKESDIKGKKDELRIVIEELLHIIDYPSWKN